MSDIIINCTKCEDVVCFHLADYGGLCRGILNDYLKKDIKEHEEYHLKLEKQKLQEIKEYQQKQEYLTTLKQNLNNFSSIKWDVVEDY